MKIIFGTTYLCAKFVGLRKIQNNFWNVRQFTDGFKCTLKMHLFTLEQEEPLTVAAVTLQ